MYYAHDEVSFQEKLGVHLDALKSPKYDRGVAVEANASINVRTVRDHFIAGSFCMA